MAFFSSVGKVFDVDFPKNLCTDTNTENWQKNVITFCLYLFPCVIVLVFLSIYQHISLLLAYVCLSYLVSLSVSWCFFLSVCIYSSEYLFYSCIVGLCLFICLSLWKCFSVCLLVSLSFCLYFCLYRDLCKSTYLFASFDSAFRLYLGLCPMPLFLSVSLSLCFCLSIYLYISVYLLVFAHLPVSLVFSLSLYPCHIYLYLSFYLPLSSVFLFLYFVCLSVCHFACLSVWSAFLFVIWTFCL